MARLRQYSRYLRSEGFTLIELLVVILIIAILMAVAAPSFLGQTKKAHDSAAQQYLTVAYQAATAWTVDHTGVDTPDANACANVAQGSYCSALAVSDAIQAFEPELTVEAGTCTSSVTTSDPSHIVVDSTNTHDGDLMLCNDPEQTIWTLTVTDHGAPSFSPTDGSTNPTEPSGNPPVAPSPSVFSWPLGQSSATLSFDPAEDWQGDQPMTFNYTWQKQCKRNDDNCSYGDLDWHTIATTDNGSYTVQASDWSDNYRLQVIATASNAAGGPVTDSIIERSPCSPDWGNGPVFDTCY